MSRMDSSSSPRKVLPGVSPSPLTLVTMVAPVAPASRAAWTTTSVLSVADERDYHLESHAWTLPPFRAGE